MQRGGLDKLVIYKGLWGKDSGVFGVLSAQARGLRMECVVAARHQTRVRRHSGTANPPVSTAQVCPTRLTVCSRLMQSTHLQLHPTCFQLHIFPSLMAPFLVSKARTQRSPRRASHPQRMQACEQLLVLVAPQYVTRPAHVKASSARIGINICSCTESNLCPPETRYAIHIVAALTRQSPPQTCPSSAGGAPRTRHSR